jgi:hypothetical protein
VKIFIIPYTFSTFFSAEKRVSGVDESMLKQIEVLKSAGHEIATYIPFTDLAKLHKEVAYHRNNVPDDIKEYLKTKKGIFVREMEARILEFNPDVILSNMYFSANFYKNLQTVNKPIVYMSHAVPGFMSDLFSANELSEFLQRNTLACVSNYHVEKTKLYYDSGRKHWSFGRNTIEPDGVVFSSYSKVEDVMASDGVVRHVSAANKDKQTFFIHEELIGTDIKSEVYTTLKYMGKADEDSYVKKAMLKFDTNDRPVYQDIPHSKIMSEISRSVCCFVGLAAYDTFTITSLEALSRGVPIIVKGWHGKHPAQEMVEPEFQKYVHVLENKKDFITAVNEFSKMNLAERRALANSCLRVTSREKYRKDLETILFDAINKYSNNDNVSLMAFF